MSSVTKEMAVGKMRSQEGKPRRYGTLIRVTDDAAKMITKAASFEGISVADFVTQYLIPLVEKRYRDAVLKEARKMKGEEP